MFVELLLYYLYITGSKKKLALLLQEMISIRMYACFQLLLIFSLLIKLLYTCSLIEVNKILFTLRKLGTLVNQ